MAKRVLGLQNLLRHKNMYWIQQWMLMTWKGILRSSVLTTMIPLISKFTASNLRLIHRGFWFVIYNYGLHYKKRTQSNNSTFEVEKQHLKSAQTFGLSFYFSASINSGLISLKGLESGFAASQDNNLTRTIKGLSTTWKGIFLSLVLTSMFPYYRNLQPVTFAL